MAASLLITNLPDLSNILMLIFCNLYYLHKINFIIFIILRNTKMLPITIAKHPPTTKYLNYLSKS